VNDKILLNSKVSKKQKFILPGKRNLKEVKV